jgi:hypothetical protein
MPPRWGWIFFLFVVLQRCRAAGAEKFAWVSEVFKFQFGRQLFLSPKKFQNVLPIFFFAATLPPF